MRATTRSRHLTTAALVAALAVGAAACGDGEADTSSFADVPVRTEQAGGETTPPEDDAPAEDGEATDTDGPVVDDERQPSASGEALPPPANPTGEPILTVEGSGDFPQLDILDLRRDGDVVTLEFAIHTADDDSFGGPNVADAFAAEQDSYYGLLDQGEGMPNASLADSRYWVSGVTLVDRANANRHLVLRDSSGACLCTSFTFGATSYGERYRHSAQFPAPPADVETMTVEVPQFPSIDAVPIRAAG